MALEIPNSSLPINPDGSNRNKTNLNINANEVVSSPGIDITRGVTGTQIVIPPSYDPSSTDYLGQYDHNGYFGIGTIIKTTASFDYDMGSTTPVGNWICESPVPLPSMRLAGIKYAPILPEPNVLAHEVSNPSIQGRYWHSIGSGGSVNYSMYDYSASYSTNDIVAVNAPTLQYTNGTSSKWSYPGIYICLQAVAALSGSAPSGSRGTTFQMPFYPDSDYWDLWAFAPNEFEGCGGVKYFVNSTVKEPPTASIVHI